MSYPRITTGARLPMHRLHPGARCVAATLEALLSPRPEFFRRNFEPFGGSMHLDTRSGPSEAGTQRIVRELAADGGSDD